MSVKKQKTTAGAVDAVIAQVVAAGIDHQSIADPWLRALRDHESEIRARVADWPAWSDVKARCAMGDLAQADHQAAKLARSRGEAIPPTPFLDELKVRQAEMVSPTKTSSARSSGGGATRTPKASGIRFTHDGKLVAATQNKLSSVAWFYTKPLGKAGGRMKVDELKKLLVELGVADPTKPGWSVKLPNGVTLGAVKEGETPVEIEKPKAEKATKATKSTAKKSVVKGAAQDASTRAVAELVPGGKSTKPKATPRKQTPKAKARATATPTKVAPDKRVRKAPAAKSTAARKSA